MATYVIGDLQGCFRPLGTLLDRIEFDPGQDRLWFAGDIVNRGPESLACLEYVKQACQAGHARMVLGNHDFHLLAAYAGLTRYRSKSDTLSDILTSDHVQDHVNWLRQQPLLIHDHVLDQVMVHAGIPPQWSLAQAKAYAQEIETALQQPDWQDFIVELFSKKGQYWSPSLQGIERQRYIVNAFVRMRYCDAAGTLDFAKKSAPSHPVPPAKGSGSAPWFAFAQRQTRDIPIFFGHWSTLGAMDAFNVHATDTGCLWGGQLSAYCIESDRRHEVDCPQTAKPKKTP
ncbi:symmetrical bis(5'-nucleosyl)-tetraphosphatase [Hydrogenovibrio halophilus]|uniref:symmetrical bis(5'-nucleosyl)-tetraphosphatase n=1 Tax=Hydrogenovibrio halophilus TaxID=373391 RepID=UPI0003786094|nr:symmetrical bis(5'-nucleosyl)-tetraphosphatase [Hydrogenovibrio halophilus]